MGLHAGKNPHQILFEARLVDLGGIHGAKAVRGKVAEQPGTPVYILHSQCSVFRMGCRAMVTTNFLVRH